MALKWYNAIHPMVAYDRPAILHHQESGKLAIELNILDLVDDHWLLVEYYGSTATRTLT